MSTYQDPSMITYHDPPKIVFFYKVGYIRCFYIIRLTNSIILTKHEKILPHIDNQVKIW